MDPQAESPIRLKNRQRHILQVVAETMLPANAGFPIAPDEKNVIVPIEKLLTMGGRRSLMGLGLLLIFFEWAALIFLPRFKPFTKLSAPDRERYLTGWMNSRIKYRRFLFLTLKALICMVFFSDAKVKAGVGYDPECLVEMKK